jgi:uncharacterized Zn finger protein (UPF0148 family)
VSDNQTYNTYGIECPYCGYVDRDAWEWRDQETDTEGDWTCPSCEREAHVVRYTTVSYTATRKEAPCEPS